MIEKKMEKESNRFIQQWPAEKIALENGRWGPFIRFQKKMLKLTRKKDGGKYLPEELSTLTLEDVKGMIEDQVPGAFTAKKRANKSAAAGKSSPAKKKVAAKKAAAPKKAAKKK